MNNALQIIEKQKAGGALVFAPLNLGELPALYKLETTVVEFKRDEFHNISGKYTPNKAVTDRIGFAAGISFIAEHCGTREFIRDDELGKHTVFVGYAQGKVRQSDGSYQESNVEEYEFDPYWRAKEESQKATAKKSEAAYRMDYLKVGRQRASTGARLRVIRAMIGMPTSFESNEIAKPFVFAKVVQNTDFLLATREGRQAAIAQATGALTSLFGPSESAPLKQAEQVEGFDANAGETEEFTLNLSPEVAERGRLILALEGILNSPDVALIGAKGMRTVSDALAGTVETHPDDELRRIVDKCNGIFRDAGKTEIVP